MAYTATFTINRREGILMDNKLTDYVLKHSKKREEELKYDFMPPLLEIIERPAHRAGTVIIWGTLSLLIVAIIWAALSRIDTVVKATGTLQPQGDVSIIKAFGNGQIESILVLEGEYVEAGAVLMEFDSESLVVEEAPLIFQQKQLAVQKEICEIIKSQTDISHIDITSYESKLQPFVSAILESHTSFLNSVEYLEKELELCKVNKELAMAQLMQYEQMGLSSQVASQKLVVKQYEVEIAKKEIELKDRKTSYMAGVTSKQAEINLQLEMVQTQLAQIGFAKDNQKVKASVSGYVARIAVNENDTVTAMQELISIVPTDKPYEIQCYVANKDVSDIYVGMEADIKLAAYDYDEYGVLEGNVYYISPTAVTNDQMGSVYIVRLEVSNIPKDMMAISGLQGTVEMKTGQRSILQYFLDPITKGLGESLKER